MQLINIVTQKVVYSFANVFEAVKEEGSSIQPYISCMQQSPAVDVVAIGFDSGHILLVNLLYSEVVM